MILLFIYISYLFTICSANYLENKESSVSYHDIHVGGAISTNYNYPYVGFGCTETYKDNLYAVTSTFYSPYWGRQGDGYKCNKPHKKVEVMKYNTINNNYTSSIITTGISDYVVSCGIDKVSNILYYISSNYFNCPSNYNLDSSITRIDLNTFTLIDNTILRNINNIPTFYEFSSSEYWDYKYIHSPSTSINIHGNSLWLAFGGTYTGIEGLSVSYGSGNSENVKAETGDQTIMKASYVYGSFTVGISNNDFDHTTSTIDQEVDSISLAYTVSDSISVTYGEETIDRSGQVTDIEVDGVSVSYTSGGMTATFAQVRADNVDHTAALDKEVWKIGLSFAF